MLFTEPRFLFLLLPIVLLLYYISPKSAKNTVLLFGSILFYSSGEGYWTFVIVFSIIYNYFAGHVIDAQLKPKDRLNALAFSIAVNLGLIVAFKYVPFFVDNINLFRRASHQIPHPKIHLPLGISFFTFHALSYVIDVYRREVKPMKSFHSFALYITLFPQLVAGPIIRYKTICDQFSVEGPTARKHTFEGFAYGIRRFIIGLGKKMLIANSVAWAADNVFGTPHAALTPAAAWLGVICYTMQIYFDFSGYSDMAIGLGHMFGFKFPENFSYPYISKSVTEFWRRWHMSLSTWFRDYLYIPLGGNRVSPGRTYFNLAVVFFLCGFWHGATWNFIVWGMYFGVFLIIERLGFGKFLEKFPSPVRHFYLLLVVVVGWVPFRSPDLHYTVMYISRMAFVQPNYAQPFAPADIFINRAVIWALIAAVIGSMPWLPAIQSAWTKWSTRAHGHPVTNMVTVGARLFELASLALVFLFSVGYSAVETYNPFIYFRF
jgi:alginate O-acetyltransferase complex protein AlgI